MSREQEAEQEFYAELIQITKQKVKLYCDMAVKTDKEGRLTEISGKLLFQKELFHLLEPDMEDGERHQYEEQMEQLMNQERILFQEAEEFIKNGVILGLPYLCRIFHLSELERQLVIFSLMPELDGQFERIYCLLQDDYGRKKPSPELVFRIMAPDRKKQLLLQKQFMERLPVLGWLFDGLWEPGTDRRKSDSFLTDPLILDERIVLFIRDVFSMDSRLAFCMKVCLPGEVQAPVIRKDLPEKMRTLMNSGSGKCLMIISGSDGSGKRTLTANCCALSGKQLFFVDAEELLKSDDMPWLVHRLIRESMLKGHAWLCFTGLRAGEQPDEKNIRIANFLKILEEYRGVPVITSDRPLPGFIETGAYHCLQMELPETTGYERSLLWKHFLPEGWWPENLTPEMAAGKYIMTPGSIRKSAEEVKMQKNLPGEGTVTSAVIYQACQRQLFHQLGKDAVRIHSPYTWEDLVLPPKQKGLLRDACNQVDYREQVYEEWGMERKVAYGRGVSVIFYGPPGTGKTMGAQVMANELNMELYKVNMASVMSKYVGDSEKRLEQIFEQGRKSQSILFFDEADVLFGKRSETKDAQDKYANASTAYLLQKVEEYEGILILATNFLQNFDNAFCRRFKFIIEFPLPDEQCRKEIWDHMFPEKMRIDEKIDTAWLASEFRFSGSQIKNIVMAASFLAAGEQQGLRMRHIVTALKREQLKIGKQMVPGDFGQYYYLAEE